MARDTSKYVIDGHRMPSVTEILRLTGLDDWSHIDPNILEAARHRGSLVHFWCEQVDRLFSNIDVEKVDPSAVPYVCAYLNFKRDTNWELVANEQSLVSRRLLYGGTPDRVFKYAGKLRVVDLKTGPPTDAAALQTAAYAMLLEENGIGTVEWRHALELRGNGTFRVHDYTSFTDRNDFRAALVIAHRILRMRPRALDEGSTDGSH